MVVAVHTARMQSAPSNIPVPNAAGRRRDYEERMSELERICASDPDAPGLDELARAYERMAYVDELPGEQMTRDYLGDYRFDPDDRLSKDRRLKEFDDLLYSHVWHRKHRPPTASFGSNLTYAGMGVGKSASVNMTTAPKFAMGWNVLANIGFFYGNRASGAAIMAFAQNCPFYTRIVVDELQDQISRLAANTVALRIFSGGAGAMMRRRKSELEGVTALRWMLPDAYLTTLDYAVKCKRWRPSTGNYIAPPWCYIRQWRIGPQPFKPKDGFEERYGIKEPDEAVRVFYRVLHPLQVFKYSHLYDTYAEVHIGESLRNSASVMRAMLGGEKTKLGRVEEAVSYVFDIVGSGDWQPFDDRFDWRQLLLEARLSGMSDEVSDNEFHAAMAQFVSFKGTNVVYAELQHNIADKLRRFGAVDMDDEPEHDVQPFRLEPV